MFHVHVLLIPMQLQDLPRANDIPVLGPLQGPLVQRWFPRSLG